MTSRTGVDRASRPSATSWRAAREVSDLVTEATGNGVSAVTGSPSRFAVP